ERGHRRPYGQEAPWHAHRDAHRSDRPLIEAGILVCSRKSYVPGKIVTSFCFGTRKLYDFIHDTPFFAFLPTEFTNDPFRIAQNRKMVSISSALEVDLTGQVCADSIGTQFYSGFGGQVDFIRGAARSEGGKPIIALLSTAKKGELSRIVATLKPGAGVVTSRADVHYVVTEYGIASLHGKSVRERTLALINIAHPKFRDDLQREARERRLLSPNQVALPAGLKPYPKQYETHQTFDDQGEIFFRPIQPTDEGLLRELFYSHSEETILQRYHKLVDRLSREQVQKMVTLDYQSEMALVGIVRDATGDRERMVCVGRYTRDKAATTAEFAVTVHDEYQGRRIGRYVLRRLIEIARENGIRSFHARVRKSNHAMMELIHGAVGRVEMDVFEDVYRVRFDLPHTREQKADREH
ncbi:MAG: GNAT family N-acetyltransferase, partial [Chthoniobacteraceae bacterium]